MKHLGDNAAALVAAMALSGCVGLPHPDASDLTRARVRWPDTQLSTLEAGREAYANRCGGCHALHVPSTQSPEAWPQHVAEMAAEAKLEPGERELIQKYLVTLAQRPR